MYIWWFPEIGVPPVLIHVNGILMVCSMKSTIQLLGLPPWLWTHMVAETLKARSWIQMLILSGKLTSPWKITNNRQFTYKLAIFLHISVNMAMECYGKSLLLNTVGTSSINCPCFIAMLHCQRVICVCVSSHPMQICSLCCPHHPSTALDFPIHVQWWSSAYSCWAPKAYWLLSPCLLCKLISAYRNWFASSHYYSHVSDNCVSLRAYLKPSWFSEIADPFAHEFLNMCSVPSHDSCNK